MRKIAICLVFVLLLVGSANAQTKSVSGTVISVDRGMYKWVTITVKVGNKEYTVYTLCGENVSYCTPKIIGNVEEVGRRVQIFYTKIINGEMRATKIVEVKKSKPKKK